MENKNSVEKLEIYKIARILSAYAWDIFNDLPSYLRFHMGDQILRSADSVGANIAEGHGKYYFKEQIRYLYQARGSLVEVFHWTELLLERKLISIEKGNEILQHIDSINIKINQFIKYLRFQSSK
jgi:four helix bundle protein